MIIPPTELPDRQIGNSPVDGREGIGFVVVNTGSATGADWLLCDQGSDGPQVLDLDSARELARKLRAEYDNEDIYVYKLVGVRL